VHNASSTDRSVCRYVREAIGELGVRLLKPKQCLGERVHKVSSADRRVCRYASEVIGALGACYTMHLKN